MLSSTGKRYMRDPVKTYLSINLGEIIDTLKARDFNATSCLVQVALIRYSQGYIVWCLNESRKVGVMLNLQPAYS